VVPGLEKVENIWIKLFKAIITPVEYMGAKLGLTLREEYRLRVFKDGQLRRICGLKGETVER
jgi:hypothetical protein